MAGRLRGHRGVVLGFVGGIIVATSAAAGASSLITGSQIKNGSITALDIKSGSITSQNIKHGTIQIADLDKALVAAIAKSGATGATGATGQSGAQGPPGGQGDPGPPGPTAPWSSATVAAAESITTNSNMFTAFADLTTPGPQVTVTVPPSGLVELYAQVTVAASTHTDGEIGLVVDGGASPLLCSSRANTLIHVGDLVTGVFATSATGCGSLVPGTPDSLVLPVTPGPHTFKLVYSAISDCACPATITFANRELFVAPRP